MTTSAPVRKVHDILIVEPRKEPLRLPTREPEEPFYVPIRVPELVPVRRVMK